MHGLETIKHLNNVEFHRFQADRYQRMADKQLRKGNGALALKWLQRRQEHLDALPDNHGNR